MTFQPTQHILANHNKRTPSDSLKTLSDSLKTLIEERLSSIRIYRTLLSLRWDNNMYVLVNIEFRK